MLKRLCIAFFRQYLFWLAFFFIGRFVFLLYNISELKSISFFQITLTFYHALYLDTSMAAYLLAFSFIMLPVYALFTTSLVAIIHKLYIIIMIIVFSIIAIADLETYDEWGTKLNIKGLKFLEHPSEAFNSVSNKFLLFGFLAVVLLTWLGVMLYDKINVIKPIWEVGRQKKYSFKNISGIFIYLIICPLLLFL